VDIKELLCKKNAYEILCFIGERDEVYYNDIQDLCGNPTTTCNRLDLLRKEGLIEKTPFKERIGAKWSAYRITEKGKLIIKITEGYFEEISKHI